MVIGGRHFLRMGRITMEAICRPADGPTARGRRCFSPFTGAVRPLRPTGSFPGTLRRGGSGPGQSGAGEAPKVAFRCVLAGSEPAFPEVGTKAVLNAQLHHQPREKGGNCRPPGTGAEQGLPLSLGSEPPSAKPRRAAPRHRAAARPPAAGPRRPCQPARDTRGGAAARRGGAARRGAERSFLPAVLPRPDGERHCVPAASSAQPPPLPCRRRAAPPSQRPAETSEPSGRR